MPLTFRYRPEVLQELARHGLQPQPATTPAFLRTALNDLYLFEIRQLRDLLKAGALLRSEYAGRVDLLRKSYPLLGLPVEHWTEGV
jgi:hypothetical protein